MHVSLGDGLAHGTPEALLRQRTLVESLGGTFHNVLGEDTADAILEFSRGVNASHIVIGETSRGPLRSALLPGASPGVIRGSGDMDVVVVTHHQTKDTGLRRRASALSPGRRMAGWVLAVLGPPLLALALLDTDNLSLVSLAMLGLTVAVALVGGLAPAVAAALIGGLALNYLFIEPIYTWTINQPSNAAALLRDGGRRGRRRDRGRQRRPPDQGGRPSPRRGRHPDPARQLRPARRGRPARHAGTHPRDLRRDQRIPAPARQPCSRLACDRIQRGRPRRPPTDAGRRACRSPTTWS